jgi:hypothetical protein
MFSPAQRFVRLCTVLATDATALRGLTEAGSSTECSIFPLKSLIATPSR